MEMSGQLHAPGAVPRYPLTGGWVGPRVGLDAVAKRKYPSLTPPGTESRTKTMTYLYQVTQPPEPRVGNRNLPVTKQERSSFRYCSAHQVLTKSRDSSVGIALGYGMNDRGSRVQFPAGAGNFSLHHRVQNGSGAHPASYTMGTRVSYRGGKAAGA
jgi:hypothetical protein